MANSIAETQSSGWPTPPGPPSGQSGHVARLRRRLCMLAGAASVVRRWVPPGPSGRKRPRADGSYFQPNRLEEEYRTFMTVNGQTRKIDPRPVGALTERLASLRRRWFSITAAEMLVVPAGLSATDCTFTHDGVFSVADGVDDVAGSGRAALSEVMGRMHLVSNERRLRAVLATASWSLRSSQADCAGRGAASVTVAFWTGARFIVGHVGDSRAYLWRRSVLCQLTTDQHLPSADLMPASPADAGRSDAHVVRLGQTASGTGPQMLSVGVEPGDKVLLCTDGLWRDATHQQMADALAGSPQQACIELRAHLCEPSSENAAAVVIAVDPLPPMPVVRPD